MSGDPVRKEERCQLLRPIQWHYLTIVLRSVKGSNEHFSHDDSTYTNGEISQSTVGRGWIVGETGHGWWLWLARTEFVGFSGPDEAGWEPVTGLDSVIQRLACFVLGTFIPLFPALTSVASLDFFSFCFLHTEPGPWRILGSVVRLAPHTNRCATRGKRRSSSRSSLVC